MTSISMMRGEIAGRPFVLAMQENRQFKGYAVDRGGEPVLVGNYRHDAESTKAAEILTNTVSFNYIERRRMKSESEVALLADAVRGVLAQSEVVKRINMQLDVEDWYWANIEVKAMKGDALTLEVEASTMPIDVLDDVVGEVHSIINLGVFGRMNNEEVLVRRMVGGALRRETVHTGEPFENVKGIIQP